MAPCKRNADRRGEPRDLVEVFYGVTPITPIEVYDSLEFTSTDNQVIRMVVTVLEANFALTQEGEVCLNIALDPCLASERQSVFASLDDLPFILRNPAFKPTKVSGGMS